MFFLSCVVRAPPISRSIINADFLGRSYNSLYRHAGNHLNPKIRSVENRSSYLGFRPAEILGCKVKGSVDGYPGAAVPTKSTAFKGAFRPPKHEGLEALHSPPKHEGLEALHCPIRPSHPPSTRIRGPSLPSWHPPPPKHDGLEALHCPFRPSHPQSTKGLEAPHSHPGTPPSMRD